MEVPMKIGDRVERIEQAHSKGIQVGEKGTITRFEGGSCSVDWDRGVTTASYKYLLRVVPFKNNREATSLLDKGW